MYENTRESIDWKGIFLKTLIAFLIVLIAVTGYKTLKGKDNKKVMQTTTTVIAESEKNSKYTANISELKKVGEKYFNDNKSLLPTKSDTSVIVTLNDLIQKNYIEKLVDEKGNTCDGESSYVTATLEQKQIKLKANLVCGETSSYSIVYMGENDAEQEKIVNYNNTVSNKQNTSNGSTSNKTEKSNTTSNTANTTCDNCKTPVVNVSTNTEVSQEVSINTDKEVETSKKEQTSTNKKQESNKTRYYTVTFDKNGGTKTYRTQDVRENDTAYNPGNNYKSGYRFIGWYLNGREFNFDTPITKNIVLKAMYEEKYNDYDYDYVYDYDYDYDYNEPKETLKTKTYKSTVYTMGWKDRNATDIEISHTLKVPNELEDLDIEKIRIKKIEYVGAIDSKGLAETYRNRHSDTFFYQRNGWESTNNNLTSLAKIRSSAVDFAYSTSYKSMNKALNNGFDVTWYADSIYKKCSNPFSVNGVSNLCNYGIVYQATWEYQIYE